MLRDKLIIHPYITYLMKSLENNIKYEYRKIQGVMHEQSYAVTLPKKYAEALGIGKGTNVKIWQESNKIIVEKA